MNLLPKSTKEFSSKKYWDSFFQKRQNAFEWYGEYSDLRDVLHKYCKPKDHVLVAGCGNSQLSQDLYDVGYHSLVNIDISDVVVRQMIAKNKENRPEMSFLKMDLLNMEFDDESFQVVLDKGTLDAIFTSEDEKIADNVKKMFAEITRVLKIGGRYICITLAQEHIHQTLMDYFINLNWFVRVHNVLNDSPLPVFAFILTKTRPTPDDALKIPQILEMVVDEKVNRLGSLDEMKKSIKASQEYALIKQHLKILHPEEQFQLAFWSAQSTKEPRYYLTVVDIKISKDIKGKFAVFIVPQGREHEWMFAEKKGQMQLALSAGYQRLVIVALSRGHFYGDLEKIKDELSERIMEIAQHGVTSKDNAPFLSIGSDVGNRKQIYLGHSGITGEYIIEDVELDGQETFRRLIFVSNKNVIQSESRLCNVVQSKISKKKKGSKKQASKVIDFSYLACSHHQALVAGLALLPHAKSSKSSLLLIGLGGGSLPMFIHKYLPQISLTIVELDPDIVQVAKNWFNFQESERMTLVIGDGLQFIKATSAKYDIVIFDADSKDVAKSLLCPPPEFVKEETINNVKTLLNPGGLFMVNVVCRDEEKRKKIQDTIEEVIPQAFSIDIENDINEVMIFRNSDILNDKSNLLRQGNQLQEQITEISPGTNVELCHHLENLKFC